MTARTRSLSLRYRTVDGAVRRISSGDTPLSRERETSSRTGIGN